MITLPHRAFTKTAHRFGEINHIRLREGTDLLKYRREREARREMGEGRRENGRMGDGRMGGNAG